MNFIILFVKWHSNWSVTLHSTILRKKFRNIIDSTDDENLDNAWSYSLSARSRSWESWLLSCNVPLDCGGNPVAVYYLDNYKLSFSRQNWECNSLLVKTRLLKIETWEHDVDVRVWCKKIRTRFKPCFQNWELIFA